jgi:hypothetical protein
MKISVSQNNLFDYETQTDIATVSLIKKVLNYKKRNHPEKYVKYRCKTYNKLTLTTERVPQVDGKINRLLSKIDFLDKTFNDTSNNRHFLIMESVTEKKFLNEYNQKEIVEASKVSGIEKSSVFAIVSQLQPFSVYTKYLRIAGIRYLSPLMNNATKWYHFKVIDTIYIQTDTVFLVKFNPKHVRRPEYLKGYLYINSNQYAVQYADFEPGLQNDTYIEFAQSYLLEPNNTWFPYQTATGIYQDRYATAEYKINIVQQTTVYDLNLAPHFRRDEFNHILMEFEDSIQKSEEYWHENRQNAFTRKDSLTYIYYDSSKKLNNLNKFIRLGEGIVYGEIPISVVNLTMNKIFDYSTFEGVRLGMGLQTNDRISKRFSVGGYLGYGLGDQITKFGVNGIYKISTKKKPTQLRITHFEDIAEAGDPKFGMDKFQFRSEALRRYLVNTMDRIFETEASLETMPIKFFSLRFAVAKTVLLPAYHYQYGERTDTNFEFGELRATMRFAFGDFYIQSVNRQIPIGNSSFPILWVQYHRSSPYIVKNAFDYHKFDVKFQYSLRIVGYGVSSWQMRAGMLIGDAPYGQLYNGRGSYRPAAAIAYNSFETMIYNEFLSDKHISIHYNHNFGNINIRNNKKQPSFEMAHNFGFGSLSNPSVHKNVNFKTMEKGYFESGFYLNNILVVTLPGLTGGLGAGGFIRYGHYATSSNPFRDIVFKFAISFQI